ncbi:MAG: sporulation-delaying protein SdpB family protein [Pyrinomonadaceae bacterium]
MFSSIDKAGKVIERELGRYPWTNVYGVARSLLALGTLLTLALNQNQILFRPASGITDFPVCQDLGVIGIFCLLRSNLEIARWVAIGILFLVLIGWRPRYTAILHWWVSFSLQTSAITVDGGDQVTSVLTLLILPIALLDNRKWHWSNKVSEPREFSFKDSIKRLISISTFYVIRFQVCIIYFHAATAKLAGEEWLDGTILYYWFTDPIIGLPNWLKFLTPIFTTPLVSIITWLSLITEIVLFMALFLPREKWKFPLILGITFHILIALTMGLISFGLAMTAALILYLRPFDCGFVFFERMFLSAGSFIQLKTSSEVRQA